MERHEEEGGREGDRGKEEKGRRMEVVGKGKGVMEVAGLSLPSWWKQSSWYSHGQIKCSLNCPASFSCLEV